jgi:NAD(P)-dependent dehydrogenase (short-subunit alcohol dehydrogenase family)
VLGDLQRQKLGSFDYAGFEQVMAVNVYGSLEMAEAFRDHLAASQQKKIVSLTSGSGIISAPNANTPWYGPYFYRASKVATNMVSRNFNTISVTKA